MSPTQFDWSTFIAQMKEITPDVVFQIVEDGQLHEVNAHKVVMAMVSITFKTMFYTTDVGDRTTKEIKIEATTKQAFQIIIDDLYKIKSIEDSLQGKSLQEIFDVVNLLERYQMADQQLRGDRVATQRRPALPRLSNYPITDDNVLVLSFSRRMSLTHFDWSTFIAQMIEIPPDVVFEIGEDGQLHEIKAHKVVMAMVSIPFKTMFYTTDVGDRTTKEIKIEATTKQAFQIIIDDLYKIKSIEDSLQGKSLWEIFDVVNLLERYQMAELQDAMNKLLFNYPITDDNALDVAEEAIRQSGMFQKEAHLLLLTCAKILKPKLKDAKSIFNYFLENEDQKEVVAALLVLMNDIAPNECSNCGYVDCQDGKEVKEGEFREGLLVTNNPAANGYRGVRGQMYYVEPGLATGKVTSVEGTTVTIEQIEGGTYQLCGGGRSTTYGGRNVINFSCN